MAEVAIPIVALGAMYIISNKKEKKKNPVESFTQRQYLPNTKPQIKNYPKDTQKDILNETNVQSYKGFKNSTENYYLPENYKRALKNEKKNLGQFQSLTGNTINSSELEHNNMVPYFGAKITQSTSENVGYEKLLDVYTGAGSQQNKKEGIAPMFKPESNMSHIHGAPVATEFMQERQRSLLTSKMNNTKPWQEIRVGPGLNKGFSSEGTGGFNAGMEARAATLPKTVDQLRSHTNPKVSYGGVTLGAYAGKGLTNASNKMMIGKVEKNRPDTSFEHGPSRWFTTTSGQKRETVRSDHILQPENRTTTTREYFGVGTDSEAKGPTQHGKYLPAHKQQLAGPAVGGASGTDKWGATNKDYGKQSYKARMNSRTLTGENNNMGVVSGVVSALTAPVLDLLRPSRKQNVIGNKRPMGNAGGRGGVYKEPVWNPNDTPHHTIREQTENTKHWMMGSSNTGDGYINSNNRPVPQQRDSTTNCYYTSGSGARPGTTNPRAYDAEYNARLNPNKEILSRVDRYNVGNQSLASHAQNVTNLKNRATNPVEMRANMPKVAANMQTHGQISGKNTRERAINCARNNPSMIQAFNQNPYSQSLNSWA